MEDHDTTAAGRIAELEAKVANLETRNGILARIDTLEAKVAELMACHEIAQEGAKELVINRLGRPPTADETDQMARGVKLSAMRREA
jgi:hypothetical protein